MVTPSACFCFSPQWSLVTVSLLPAPQWDLIVVSGIGHLIYSFPLATLMMKKSIYSYRNRCLCRREKHVIKLLGLDNISKSQEELMLWAEEEDIKGWLEVLDRMKRTILSPSDVTVLEEDVIESSSSYHTRLGKSVGEGDSSSKIAGEVRTAAASSAVPDWASRIPRVSSKESDMITFDYDEMFRELKPLETNQERGTAQLVASVVRQLIVTMNPSKVRLPACVLECRSLLESYADAFGRPELFNTIPSGKTAAERLEKVASFFLSQLKCMRPVSCVSKPYNPVHGEVFMCFWPEEEVGSVHFVAEQVSHHPPVSSFYAECREASISFTATLFTKSGLVTSWQPPFLKAMTVEYVGQATISLDSHEEVYTMTYPTAVATGIIGSSPRLLLDGTVNITCSSHKGRVELTFEEESLVRGNVFGTESSERVATVVGDWRGLVEMIKVDGTREDLLQMKDWRGPKADKVVPSVAVQIDLESRRLWRLLTRALAGKMTEIEADTAKRSVEDWARNTSHTRNKGTLQFFDVDLDNLENVKFKY